MLPSVVVSYDGPPVTEVRVLSSVGSALKSSSYRGIQCHSGINWGVVFPVFSKPKPGTLNLNPKPSPGV